MTLYLRENTWWVDAKVGDRRIRRSLGTSDHEEAEALARSVCAVAEEFRPEGPRSKMMPLIAKRHSAAQHRAATRGKPFTLTKAEVTRLFLRAAGRCEVTGIPFSTFRPKGTGKAPFTPTIDRIDNAAPYSFENCRIVCLAANIAMNEWGEWVLKRMVSSCIARNAARPVQSLPISVPHDDSVPPESVASRRVRDTIRNIGIPSFINQ